MFCVMQGLLRQDSYVEARFIGSGPFQLQLPNALLSIDLRARNLSELSKVSSDGLIVIIQY